METNESRLFILWGVFLAAVLVVAGCSESDSPNIIHLKQIKYDNALPPNAAFDTFDPTKHIFTVKERNNITGIPDTLKELNVWHDFIYSDQYFYYAYKKGDWSEEEFNNMSPPIDTSSQTEQWVDCISTIAFGKDKNGQWVTILDKDNDEDLSDEEPITFSTDTLEFKTKRMAVKRAQVDLTFEIYRDNQILTQTEPFILTYSPTAGVPSIGINYDKYRRGKWQVNKQTFDVALFSFGYEAVYNPGEFTYLLIDLNKDGQFDIMPGNNESYRTDRPFNVFGETFQVDSINAIGTKIHITKPDTSVLPALALRKGASALNFKAQTIGGDSLAFSNLRGKFVLLDFWGTWCGPCLKEIPNLKEAYSIFSDKNFEIVGICVDQNIKQVRDFVKERNIKWPQIYEPYGQVDQPISNLYRVTGYPTQYLVNPDGNIVAFGNELKGDQLIKTLNTYIK
ncbi:TlpA family protein disulfide reductase [Fodinibius halophilus]|uniref:TlpA family protein disulfide reductase n=1 Tax=Fodinibius halophilus TaxID=1736908 RepID=A0A6M1SX46_9BACT|nr:TlpA disulfide reductase family protein [Fodinibius halophilus]NGP88468.1 TlpA family protein disulfide reductase [Fodinibius halophilus]